MLQLTSNSLVAHIALFNPPKKFENYKTISEKVSIVWDVQLSDKNCGSICSEYFVYNIHSYTLSVNYNSCLYKKISIDSNGYIRNCPSMQKNFGLIGETKLNEVIKLPEFTQLWNITKDTISKCKDCEFRRVCTDCRAYLENPEDIYSAPLKCGYDPHTGIWEEWSTNPIKQQSIKYYEMLDFVNNE